MTKRTLDISISVKVNNKRKRTGDKPDQSFEIGDHIKEYLLKSYEQVDINYVAIDGESDEEERDLSTEGEDRENQPKRVKKTSDEKVSDEEKE